MIRAAGIDCGTNSLRLLISDIERDPSTGQARATDVVRRMEIVRLGQGVDRTGRLASDALDRTFATLRDYRAQIDASGAERVRMVATSATRDAANRDEFVHGVEAILGVRPDVVSGATEAALSFAGATRDLASGRDAEPYLVVDIGGGSTEFVLGREAPLAVASVDVGCVRMTERHFHDDPPTRTQIDAARHDIDAAIDVAAAAVDLGNARTLVGVAGTVTTIAGMALGLATYDADRIHLSRLGSEQIDTITDRLLGMTRDERAGIPVMHPGRVDVIAAGALVLQRIVARVGLADLVVSEHDILDGIALSAAGVIDV